MSIKISCGCNDKKGCTSEINLTHIDYDNQNFVEMLVYNDGTPNSIHLNVETIRKVIEELQKLENNMWDKILSEDIITDQNL